MTRLLKRFADIARRLLGSRITSGASSGTSSVGPEQEGWLGRKVALEKWSSADNFPPTEVPADLVQKELRTTKNELSFWKTGSDGREVWHEAALAIVGGFKRIDPVDVAWLTRQSLTSRGVELRKSRGDTCIPDLVANHIDATRLDGHRLAAVGSALAEAVNVTRTCHRLTRQEVVDLLASAVRERRVSTANLPQAVRSEVDERLRS